MTQHKYSRPVFTFLLFSIFLGTGSKINATDYYLSWRTGNDTNSGLSQEAPWKSIARVNHANLRPGDRVLLHAGEVWREGLRPSVSGAQDQPIIFTSYGLGSRPILDGRNADSDSVSKSSPREIPARDVAIDNNEQSHIVYDGLDLRHVLEGFVPYPRGLNHWGVYLVGGIQHFLIDGNTFGPSGEDAITIWHSAYGEISHNRGGGNGENTIDVKDSHDIVIRNNDADLDREYNIVVHSVDTPDSTYNVHVERNRCSRGGQGAELSAGIALLFVQRSGVEDNMIDFAYGSGILIKDAGTHSENWASRNRLSGNGVGQKLAAIVLQGASAARIEDNLIVPPPNPVK